jgi:hypothetical protein
MSERHVPPAEPSEEAGRVGLALARAQGAAYGLALKHMTDLVAAYGEAKPAGDYLVGLALEKAEGLHVWTDGALLWQEPAGENLHVEIAVRDAADGRFVPGLTVHISIADAKGGQLVACELPFLWHPTLYHYGRNVQVSAEREITILTRISPPTFARHDKVNGCRYLSPVEASFGPIGLGFLPDGRS